MNLQAIYDTWVPKYLQVQPAKIRITILYRFVFASVLCFVLDYQLLALFLSLTLFDVRRPVSSLNEAFGWTFFSVYTSVVMLAIRGGVAGYGWLLCNVHYSDPVLCRNRRDRFAEEWPLLLRMFFAILFIATMTSLLYVSFAASEGESWHYLLSCGLFCAVSYFVNNFERHLTRFPLPMLHIDFHAALLNTWWQILKRSGREALYQTVLFSPIYWYSVGWCLDGTVTVTQTGLHLQGWLLSTLILAKLHMVRKLYGLVMQRPLSLINDSPKLHETHDTCLFNIILGHVLRCVYTMQMRPIPRSLQVNSLLLPLTMVLSVGRIHGFRMLASREFYSAMSGKLGRELFALNDVKNIHSNWTELRDLLVTDAEEFVVRLQKCIGKCHANKEIAGKVSRSRMRSLTKPSPRRKPAKEPSCECPAKPQETDYLKYLYLLGQSLRKRIREFGRRVKGHLAGRRHWQCYMLEVDVLADLHHELRCGEPLVWTLQGLVGVFMRSVADDRYGVVQPDLRLVLETLHKVERQLNLASGLIHKNRCSCAGTCRSHELLMAAVQRCQCRMLVTFGPHLDFIVGRGELKKELEERMALIY